MMGFQFSHLELCTSTKKQEEKEVPGKIFGLYKMPFSLARVSGLELELRLSTFKFILLYFNFPSTMYQAEAVQESSLVCQSSILSLDVQLRFCGRAHCAVVHVPRRFSAYTGLSADIAEFLSLEIQLEPF